MAIYQPKPGDRDEDERTLARRAEEARGHHLTRDERSERAYELSQDAPVVRRGVTEGD